MPASLTSKFHVKVVRLVLGVQLAIGLWSNDGYDSTSRRIHGREVVNEAVGWVVYMSNDYLRCLSALRTTLGGQHCHLPHRVAAACYRDTVE